MSDFQVAIKSYGGTDIVQLSDLKFAPKRWSGEASTGEKTATIDVSGNAQSIWQIYNYLGHRIEIINPHGQTVWRGRIWSTVVDTGGVSLGYSLDDMFNRVRAIYLEQTDSGEPARRTTDWDEDAASIDAFGEFELQISEGETTQTAAEKARNQELNSGSSLTEILSIGTGTQVSGRIECRGWIDELDKKYYSQSSGRKVYEVSAGDDQPLGVGIPSPGAGTFVFAEPNEIRDIGGHLAAFKQGMRLTITGTSSNNTAVEVTRGVDGDPTLYTSAGLYFDAPDNIYDGDSGLGFLEDETMLIIIGSSSNNGVYGMEQWNADNWVEVSPDTLVFEDGGGYYVCAANNIEVFPETIVDENLPAAAVVTTDTKIIAQSVLFDSATNWTLSEIAIQIGKVGDPADNIQVTLHADSAGMPGTLLSSSTVVAGSDIGFDTDWKKFTFPNDYTLVSGTTYWIAVYRTGADSTTDYYNVGVVAGDEDRYAGGELKLWDGAQWLSRSTDADMPFRLIGAWETTKQIEEIVSQCGQHITDTEIPVSSGIETPQYRDGDETGYTEISDLMASGFSDGSRMLIRVTGGAKLYVYKDSASESTPKYALKLDGKLQYATGDPIAEGMLPLAEYVTIPDAPIPYGSALNPFYIEFCEYNAKTKRYTVRPKGSSSPWSVGSVLPG